MYGLKIRDADSYRARLEHILGDALLRFNPYAVSDERLMAGLEKMSWRGAMSLTQAVILTFDGIRTEGSGLWAKEWVTYHVGDSDTEVLESMTSLTNCHTACDSLKQVRHTIRRPSRPRRPANQGSCRQTGLRKPQYNHNERTRIRKSDEHAQAGGRCRGRCRYYQTGNDSCQTGDARPTA